jgi:hypothetical protein
MHENENTAVLILFFAYFANRRLNGNDDCVNVNGVWGSSGRIPAGNGRHPGLKARPSSDRKTHTADYCVEYDVTRAMSEQHFLF